MATLYFDITKFRRQNRHRSGLNRVSAALQHSLGQLKGIEVKQVAWSVLQRSYVIVETGKKVNSASEQDAFFSPETFALRDRPFCRSWMRRFRGRTGTLFLDAIPYFHPETTWPRSVRRFPYWFKDLACYDRILFISPEARDHAREVHEKTGWGRVEGSILPLGSDYAPKPLPRNLNSVEPPVLLNIGIIEPRKGQARLLEAAENLWQQGHSLKLVFLGRVNPHFGDDIVAYMKELQAKGRPIHHEPDADDSRLAYWHQHASLAVLPTRAEGFGLPAVESLWAGCPVLATSQPSLADLQNHSGVRILESATTSAIKDSLQKLIEHPDTLKALESEICRENLPLWSATADQLARDLGFSVNS